MKSKLQPRNLPARFIYHMDQKHIHGIYMDNGTRITALLTEFQPLHNALEPATRLAQVFSVKFKPKKPYTHNQHSTFPNHNTKRTPLPGSQKWDKAPTPTLNIFKSSNTLNWLQRRMPQAYYGTSPWQEHTGTKKIRKNNLQKSPLLHQGWPHDPQCALQPRTYSDICGIQSID